jgi:hypothetical protein
MIADLLTQEVGLWVGLIVSLAILSLVLGDHLLARLAQHLLVGAALGYLALLALREVLVPRLFLPLLQAQASDQQLWVPLILGVVLWVAGLDLLREQSQPVAEARPAGRQLLHLLGAVPLALMLGVGVTVAVLGVLQGTLVPQFWRAVDSIPDGAPPLAGLLTGVLTLLLTVTALLAVTLPTNGFKINGLTLTQPLLGAAIWLGQRAIWIVAGILFARLAAARLSLLIGRIDYFISTLQQTQLWSVVRTLWE